MPRTSPHRNRSTLFPGDAEVSHCRLRTWCSEAWVFMSQSWEGGIYILVWWSEAWEGRGLASTHCHSSEPSSTARFVSRAEEDEDNSSIHCFAGLGGGLSGDFSGHIWLSPASTRPLTWSPCVPLPNHRCRTSPPVPEKKIKVSAKHRQEHNAAHFPTNFRRPEVLPEPRLISKLLLAPPATYPGVFWQSSKTTFARIRSWRSPSEKRTATPYQFWSLSPAGLGDPRPSCQVKKTTLTILYIPWSSLTGFHLENCRKEPQKIRRYTPITGTFRQDRRRIPPYLTRIPTLIPEFYQSGWISPTAVTVKTVAGALHRRRCTTHAHRPPD